MAQLVIALDVPSTKEACAMADMLAGRIVWLKVGLQLFTLGGPDLIMNLKKKGFKIFLDLKYYDIPNTVGLAARAAMRIGADMLTLHCQGGKKMCRAAMEALADYDQRPLLFGVTVLTSFASGEMPGISLSPEQYARNLAGDAAAWGLDGVVCAGTEAQRIKNSFPGLLALCPGIRPDSHNDDDQARVTTPAQAVVAGADYLVVGRPVIKSANPVKTVSEILLEMDNA